MLRLAVLLLPGLLAGCSEPAAPSTPADTGNRAVSWPAPAATLAPEEVPGLIEAALADGVTDPWGLANAWFDLFDHADPSCPAGNQWNLPVNYGGCTTAEGWHFAGTGTFSKSEGRQVGFETSHDCEVIEPDGTRFFGSGTWGVSVPAESGNYSIKASGSYAWPSATGLLGEGFSVWLAQWGELDPTGGTFNVEGVAKVRDTPMSLEIAADATCPEGQGTIGLRDPSGGWYELTLDCSGCGPLTYEGAAVGTSCPALADAWAASLESVRPGEYPWR